MALIKGVLALCLLCNALAWSIHVDAAPIDGATPVAVQADAGDAASIGDAGATATDLSDHCSHGELHFVGIIPTFKAAVAARPTLLVPNRGRHYVEPGPDPFVTPPIA
ncbi:hypothetical protein [Salinisphaera hydrothermalis]